MIKMAMLKTPGVLYYASNQPCACLYHRHFKPSVLAISYK